MGEVKKEVCSFRGYLNSQDLSGSKGKQYYTAIALKKIVELLTIEEMADKKAVREVLAENLSSEIFVIKSEMNNDITTFVDQIVRYAQWEKTLGRKLLNTLVNHNLEVEDETIKVSADIIMENVDGIIDVIKFKRKKPEMTKGGRMTDTDPKQSIELYCLQQLGQALYPGKQVVGSIYYLQKKDEKNIKFLGFDEKPGTNVISYHFDDLTIQITDIEERIKNIVLDKGTINSSKCNEKKCGSCQYTKICNYTHIDKSVLELVPQIEKAKKVLLTFNQKELIKFETGYLRANAVAGAGKTTSLCMRVIELIQNNYYEAKDFLLITFTEKGVLELKEKMTYWVKAKGLDINVEDITIRTFNGFGYDIIKQEYKNLGFTSEPQLLDKLDRYDIIGKLLDNEDEIEGLNYRYPLMDLFSAKGAIVETAEVLEMIKNDGYTFPEELVEILGMKKAYAESMFGIYMKFQKELMVRNLLQYQDQIDHCITLLGMPENVEKYGFAHITIDEYQDTNSGQNYIASQLVKYSKFISLVICGDDAQSIFSWRGGNQDNIINFHKAFPETRDIFLKNNFRSTNQISELANELNDLNTKKINKRIISNRDGVAPQMSRMDVPQIIDYIKQKISDGIPKCEIGVIARTKSELLEVEKALKLENIPCLLAGAELLKDNDNVKNIIGFSNFLIDTKLNLHFAEFLQITQYEAFTNATDTKLFVSSEKNKFLGEYEPLNEIERIGMVFKLLEPLAIEDRAVERLIEVCGHKKFATIKSLSEFLNKIESYDSEIAIEKDDSIYNSVVLTTAHASKGREFEVVIGLISKFDYNMVNMDKRDEERRVLFVLITRAKEQLMLAVAKNTGFVEEIEKIIC